MSPAAWRAGVHRLVPWLAPLTSLLVVLALWQAASVWGNVPAMLLPRPLQALQALLELFVSGEVWQHLGATLKGAAVGYALGSALALVLAALMAVYRPIDRLLMTHVQAFQAIPKVALAPLVFIWFGFGSASTITLVTMSCFYPVFVNAFVGFRAADPNLIDLYRAFGAGRGRTFWSVRLPWAASQIFVGLEIGVVFSLISAVVMEFICGTEGLGYLIQAASTTLDTASVFASLMLLAAIGIGSSALVRLSRRAIVFWEAENRTRVKLALQ